VTGHAFQHCAHLKRYVVLNARDAIILASFRRRSPDKLRLVGGGRLRRRHSHDAAHESEWKQAVRGFWCQVRQKQRPSRNTSAVSFRESRAITAWIAALIFLGADLA